MKCYLVNLDRAPERLLRMTQILDCHKINFERFPAVDGRDYSDNDMSIFEKQSTVNYKLVAGDIACGASHLEILKKIAHGDDEYAAIMEDDIHLSDDAGHFLNTTDWIPDRCDVIKLETVFFDTVVSKERMNVGSRRYLSRLQSNHGGTGLYIVSRNAADAIVKKFQPGMQTIDHYIFGDLLSSLNVFQMMPALAVQDQISGINSAPFLASSIHPYRIYLADVASGINKNRKKSAGFHKIIREVKRAIKKIKRVPHIIMRVIVIYWNYLFKNKRIGKVKFRK